VCDLRFLLELHRCKARLEATCYTREAPNETRLAQLSRREPGLTAGLFALWWQHIRKGCNNRFVIVTGHCRHHAPVSRFQDSQRGEEVSSRRLGLCRIALELDLLGYFAYRGKPPEFIRAGLHHVREGRSAVRPPYPVPREGRPPIQCQGGARAPPSAWGTASPNTEERCRRASNELCNNDKESKRAICTKRLELCQA